MSSYAKAIVGGIAAVLIAGITAWQAATVDGFHLISLFPVATAVAGAVLTYVAPNVPELPTMKAWVSGAFAILTALSTAITGQSAKADVVTIAFAGLGALATWYVPNYATNPAHPVIEPEYDDEPGAHAAMETDPDDPHGDGLDVAQALERLKQQDAQAAASQMGEATADPGPLPIEAEAQAAAAEQTSAADTVTTTIPAAPAPAPLV